MTPTDDRNKSGRTAKGTFAPGNPGGPGRRPGRGPAAEIRAALGHDLHPILAALRAKALEGDIGAIKLIVDRLVPPLKPEELAAELDLAEGSLSDHARTVLAAIADGRIGPSQGATIITALSAAARVVEVDELISRIEALEQRSQGTQR